jgi:hypothetical protein
MRELWIGQLYGDGLRECTFIDESLNDQRRLEAA